MLGQIAVFLIDTVATFMVLLLLARFHFQWLRVPFHNPAGEFVLAATNWIAVPARRMIPGIAGLDLPTLLLAWAIQAFGWWAQLSIGGADPAALPIVAVALVDLVRYSLYILVFAVIVQAVLSWVNPYAPLAPAFDAMTRPFLRPLRRIVPLLGSIDITPLILLVILQVLLIPVGHLRLAAAGL